MTIDKALKAQGFTDRSPAYRISRFPTDLRNLPSGSAAQNAELLKQTMNNMYTYGRNLAGWKWLAGENPYAVKRETSFSFARGFSAGTPGTSFTGRMTQTHLIKGFGLLAGSPQCDWSNCEGYAVALKVFAERILGITDIEMASITGHYLTAPLQDVTIDRSYGPTVKTATKTFKETKVFYYATHAFLRYNGAYFDVTGNVIFDQSKLNVRANDASEAKMADLEAVADPPTKRGKESGDKLRMFKLTNVNGLMAAQVGLVPGRTAYLMELAENPKSWSNWIITEADQPRDVSKID